MREYSVGVVGMRVREGFFGGGGEGGGGAKSLTIQF